MKIIATGSYLPSNTLSNDDLSKFLDTSDEWIKSRTGISIRHIVKTENTSNLAINAVQNAINNIEISLEKIDFVIVATSTPDSNLPTIAAKIVKYFNLSDVLAFDINMACTGFVGAMDIAQSLIKSRGFEYGIIVASDVMSKIVDWNDRNTSILFGDGAGAVIIKNDSDTLLHVHNFTNPDFDNVLINEQLTIKNPLINKKSDSKLIMKGPEVYKFATSCVEKSITSGLIQAGLSYNDVDFFVIHQANQRIMDTVAKRLNIQKEKFYSTISSTANTSAASIPIALDFMNKEGLLEKDMILVLTGFGAGLSYGTVILKW